MPGVPCRLNAAGGAQLLRASASKIRGSSHFSKEQTPAFALRASARQASLRLQDCCGEGLPRRSETQAGFPGVGGGGPCTGLHSLAQVCRGCQNLPLPLPGGWAWVALGSLGWPWAGLGIWGCFTRITRMNTNFCHRGTETRSFRQNDRIGSPQAQTENPERILDISPGSSAKHDHPGYGCLQSLALDAEGAASPAKRDERS
jgi:hypothetical protein